jgi:hypothetical protein
MSDLQSTYGNYKSTLQTIASKIGDIEQETEEHKYAPQYHIFRVSNFTPASHTALLLESSLQQAA